jgi:hypothetical protein
MQHDPLGLDEGRPADAVHGPKQLHRPLAHGGAARVDRHTAGGQYALDFVAASGAPEQLALGLDADEQAQLAVEEPLDRRDVLEQLVEIWMLVATFLIGSSSVLKASVDSGFRPASATPAAPDVAVPSMP